MEMFTFDANSTTAIVAGVVGIITWLVKDQVSKRRAAKGAMLVLIRNQLIAAHRLHMEGDEIEPDEKQSFLEMHSLYTSLGGNGATSHLVDDIDRLRVRSIRRP